MNKKYLLKRQKNLKNFLTQLEARTSAEGLTRDQLTEIETQVEETTTELEQIAEAIAELPEEDVTDLGDVVEDLGAAAQDVEDEMEIIEDELDSEDAIETASTEQRSGALAAIRKGLQTRAADRTKNVSQRSAFLRFLGGRISQAKARSLGVGFNNGKVLVPKELDKEIISYLQEENPLRRLATVHQTKGTQGFPVQIKKAVANINKTERNAAKPIPFTEIEFDDVFLEPVEFDAIIKVTKKLTHMSDFDIEAIVIEELKKAYLAKEAFWYFSSPENPGSLANKAVKFIVKAGTTNNYLKLVQLKNALPTQLRKGAVWLINRTAQTEIESILDTTGNPVLKESGNEDFDFTLLGYPVEVTDYADKYDKAATDYDPTVPMINFGNFGFFHVQDVIGTLEIEKLSELFATENKIGFKIYHINDGQLVYGPFETPVYSLDLSNEE